MGRSSPIGTDEVELGKKLAEGPAEPYSFLFIAPLIAISAMSIEYIAVLMIESMTLVATIAALSVGMRICVLSFSRLWTRMFPASIAAFAAEISLRKNASIGD